MMKSIIFEGTLIETEEEWIELGDYDQRDHGPELGRETGWIFYWTMPGYMDRGDYHLFETLREALYQAFEDVPECWTWYVDESTAHIQLSSEEEASALAEYVSTICGSRVERDGDFLYAPIDDIHEAMGELSDAGFKVEEA
jgi:hypothetical protein